MNELVGFEQRLLHALTEIDARRPVAAPSRSRKRRRGRLMVAGATVMTLGLGATAVGAATGFFEPAPPQVKGIFDDLDGVDAGKAVRVGVIDDHVTYAAPASGGGYCFYFGPNPRSGPSGSSCVTRDADRDEVMFSVLAGSDGGFLFGRVGDRRATTVKITFPEGTATLRARVVESGFFAVTIPERAMRTMYLEIDPKDDPKANWETKDGGPILSFDLSKIPLISVVALDARNQPVGHGVPVEPSGSGGESGEPSAAPS